MKTACKILVQKYPERASLGEIIHKKEDNIKMSLEGTGCEGLKSSVSRYGVVVGPCEHNNEHLISRISGELLTTLSDCKLLHGHRHLLLTYRSMTVTLQAPVSVITIGQVTISDNSSGWYLGGTQFYPLSDCLEVTEVTNGCSLFVKPR